MKKVECCTGEGKVTGIFHGFVGKEVIVELKDGFLHTFPINGSRFISEDCNIPKCSGCGTTVGALKRRVADIATGKSWCSSCIEKGKMNEND